MINQKTKETDSFDILFHMSSFEAIKAIIDCMGFKASYCKESLYYRAGENIIVKYKSRSEKIV